jgi:glutamate synthase (NADPH/NADH) small chain
VADARGFMNYPERELPGRRPIEVRIGDWREVYGPADPGALTRQASRCMDCGVPFCHHGCPLGNLIPEWNDLMRRGDGKGAIERLHETNNFPEFTGRLCPAPCESSCVLGINQPPVTIKNIEVSIINDAWENGWVKPLPPERLTGKTVAVVGSGPAGLAAAQQLTRVGHTVAVFERDDRIGGLLRYGIPDFKMEKHHLDMRLAQMQEEGTRFRPGVTIGVDITWRDLTERYDAVIVATGATIPRDLAIPGRELGGIYPAMDYLTPANKVQAGDEVVDQIHAKGKHVVILGGGDTGADCLGTAHRQQAASTTMLAIGKQPPTERPVEVPWPVDPILFEVQSAHEEGGAREFLASTVRFIGNDQGQVRAIEVCETEYRDGGRFPKPGTEREIPADLVLLALGYQGAEHAPLHEQVGLGIDGARNLERDRDYSTSVPGVFVAGDAGRGASLIVWAIAEGRAVAAEVDRYLEGTTLLPSPVSAFDRPLSV